MTSLELPVDGERPPRTPAPPARGALTLRGKAILFLVPVIVVISSVYTFEAIQTEKAILRAEVLKRGQTIAAIAGKAAELAVLSENPELLRRAVQPLKSIQDVSFVALYNRRGGLLLHEGEDHVADLPRRLSPDNPIDLTETPLSFDFVVPVFAVRAGADLDIFEETASARPVHEHIGWARVGISREGHRKAVVALIRKGSLLGLLFCAGGVLSVYYLIALATRPLNALIGAVKGLGEGENAESASLSTGDEVGRLWEEFRRMSRAIRDREATLLASKRRVQSLFERVEHAIFRLDAQGNIVECNEKFRAMFPVPSNLGSLFALEASQGLTRALSGDMRQAEEALVGKDGAEYTVMMSVYAECDERGVATGFDGYLVDISEKKKLEEALIQTQKLESIGLLAGGIAHDFNNILTGILGYAELLSVDPRRPEIVLEYAGIIQRSAERAAALTRQLLGFARKGKVRVSPLDVNAVASELLLFLRETFDRAITIAFRPAKDIPTVLGDSTQIYQALLNLCINARDSLSEGGRVSISTELCCLEVEQVHESFRIPPGQYVRIDVTDTGSGMAPEVRKRIFEPFFTTKEVGRGTGLGLSMVYGIVKNHGGYISALSEPGCGTTMRIHLPATEGVAKEAQAVAPGCGELKGATLLVVEDEDLVRQLVKEILEARSYRVFQASNGSEGVRVFAEQQGSIDLVLLDMVMPEKSGTQVFKEIRAIRPDTKILLCSGYGEEEYFKELFELGAAGFVPKPIRFAELLNQVQRAIAGGTGGST